MIRRATPARSALVLCAFFASVCPWSSSRGGDETPDARRLFDEMISAYKALPAYADKGELVLEVKVGGRSTRKAWPMALSFVRPNKIALDAGDVRLIGDGETTTTVIVPSKKFMTSPAPKSIDSGMLAEGPLGAVLLGGPAGPGVSPLLSASVLLNLLTGEDPAVLILEQSKGMKLDEDATIAGKTLKVIRVQQSRGPDLRLAIDPATKLLARIELAVAPNDLGEKVPGVSLAEAAIGWNSGPVSTETPKQETFAFKAPEGYTKVQAIEVVKNAGGPGEGPHSELLGLSSPEFSLTILDGADKLKRITKADLAGKVVMLDFWATWCPPCMVELPEVAKIIDAYAKEKKDLVVVAVSQDSDPKDLAGVRKLIEKTLADAKIALIRDKVGLIAVDSDHASGDVFGVTAIPCVVLIDREGVVQAVHVGYNENVREVLTHDIDSLLAGTPLVKKEKEKVEADAKPKE